MLKRWQEVEGMTGTGEQKMGDKNEKKQEVHISQCESDSEDTFRKLKIISLTQLLWDLTFHGDRLILWVHSISILIFFSLNYSWFIMLFQSLRSDQISRSVVSSSLRPHESQHARPPYRSPAPGVHPDSRPSSQ